jgi:hypothetical protein
MYSCDLFRYWALKSIPCLRAIFTSRNGEIPVGKSEKETWLNRTIQPFARECFGAISPVQLLAAKDSQLFFCLKLL